MRQILLLIFILFVCSLSAEQFKITGKVVDAEYKDPFFGVLVEIKDADSCTSTDIYGNFSIEVEKGAILKFSFVGCHSKEVEILNDSSLIIELEGKLLEDMSPEEIKFFSNCCKFAITPQPYKTWTVTRPIERDSLITPLKSK
ncbi:MAG: carboxypeptidase-like regulatory domain-containing protein [Bacteroidales bacterium]|nr:carboxypeptidase-like regulatory domain-containing protein [Bacteroidales bacterium]